MYLEHLFLQNFRSYTKSQFTFNKGTTVIVGPNTSGKSNLIEAIFLLSSGKSFRTETNIQMIRFGEQIGRARGEIGHPGVPPGRDDKISKRGDSIPYRPSDSRVQNDTVLEVVVATGEVSSASFFHKRFLVNNVPKRRVAFMEHFHALLFVPSHLDIIVGSPSLRRNFLDEALESVDREYRLASIAYEKALRQRNALLHFVRETGRRDQKRFEYWDNLIIQNGQIMTAKRGAFIEFINSHKKELIDFIVEYDRSIISEERLEQYRSAEEASGVTLVGPHRDDFSIRMYANVNSANESELDVKFFGSRGQQRLVVLQLKLLQLAFMEEKLGIRPILLLDDIFSELDDDHIRHVIKIIGKQQTIITTTHREFIENNIKIDNPIELNK